MMPLIILAEKVFDVSCLIGKHILAHIISYMWRFYCCIIIYGFWGFAGGERTQLSQIAGHSVLKAKSNFGHAY